MSAMPVGDGVKLRPLEREDLPFVHQLDNNASVMRYWFEEPYEAFVELSDLYDKHIHDQSERRFVVEHEGSKAGLVELVEIKLYLIVDKENEKAIHIYTRLGFKIEGELIHEFFINGEYRNTIRMCIFQHQYLEHTKPTHAMVKPTAQ